MSEKNIPGRLSRRRLVEAGALGVLALTSIPGCEALSTKPKQKNGDDNAGARLDDKEAPALARLVKAGDLPPLKERLPASPMVVEPVERLGTYGGSWRMGITGGSGSFSQLNRFQGYEGLVRWTPDWDPTPIPNVAESFEVGDGGRSYTFKLRAGMRWSDGEPFTADDVLFWYEDVVLDKELTPVPPSWMMIDDKLGKVVKVDEPHRGLRVRQGLRALPPGTRATGCGRSGAVREALPEPVPQEAQRRHRRNSSRSTSSPTGCSCSRTWAASTTTASGTASRVSRCCIRGSSPSRPAAVRAARSRSATLLLEGRSEGPAAAVHRPARVLRHAGRQHQHVDAQGGQRRDRHGGPVLRRPGEQAGDRPWPQRKAATASTPRRRRSPTSR